MAAYITSTTQDVMLPVVDARGGVVLAVILGGLFALVRFEREGRLRVYDGQEEYRENICPRFRQFAQRRVRVIIQCGVIYISLCQCGGPADGGVATWDGLMSSLGQSSLFLCPNFQMARIFLLHRGVIISVFSSTLIFMVRVRGGIYSQGSSGRFVRVPHPCEHAHVNEHVRFLRCLFRHASNRFWGASNRYPKDLFRTIKCNVGFWWPFQLFCQERRCVIG